MIQPANSYRTILRSSSIMGVSSVINIVAGLAKMKAAAVLLGPAGVGLISLYQNLMQTSATVASLGFSSVGTRQIAEAQATGGEAEVASVRRALFWGTAGLAFLGALVFWLASDWMARDILGMPEKAHEISWLALGVLMSVAAGSQSALLIGLRRVGDVARIGVISGIAGTALGIAALAVWGAEGLLAMVLLGPLASFLAGYFYAARLGSPKCPPTHLPEIWSQWRRMAALGGAFMLSGLVASGGYLVARLMVQRDLGTEALGQFQAAWAIGITYLGFILGSMGTDFYPRLTAVIGDQKKAVQLVNEQTEVALLLIAPVLLTMIALAPLVVRLLYTAEFDSAVDVLRWQLLGDVFKVMSWPLGYVLLAQGAGRTFVLTEGMGIGVLLLGLAAMLSYVGVQAAGIAVLLMYMVYLPIVWMLAHRQIGFRWNSAVMRQAVGLALSAVVVAMMARRSETLATACGLALATAFSIHAFLRLSAVAQLNGPFGKLAAISRQALRRGGGL